mmetsp:Transcript_54944/g.62340  ORF Transcript_54944/g.62340 Transcript_54944/m.62340 type:complete len:158 (+) Transcript_54944:332-805(+)
MLLGMLTGEAYSMQDFRRRQQQRKKHSIENEWSIHGREEGLCRHRTIPPTLLTRTPTLLNQYQYRYQSRNSHCVDGGGRSSKYINNNKDFIMERVSELPVTATAVSMETLAAATVSAAIETTTSTTTTTTNDSDGDGDVYGDCNSTGVVDRDPENDN